MKPFYSNLKFITVGILAALSIYISNVAAQTSISVVGTSYLQNFNSLTGSSWVNNSTLEGWYSLNASGIPYTAYTLNDGESPTTGLVSFGSVDSPVDRSLGFAPAGVVFESTMYIGWRLKNTTGQTIQSINVTWTGEQWSSNDNSAQYLSLYYQLSASPITSINVGSLQTTAYSFESPIIDVSGKLDGNNDLNKVTYTSNIAVTIAPNSEIMVVWEKTDGLTNHLLSIDDLSVTARATQDITFDNLPTKNYGDATFSLTASASSGLPITYTSSNTNVATVSGSTVTIKGPGRSFITASQAGNANYTAAANQTKPLNVKPKIPISSVATGISTTTFTANWTADNGLTDASTSYIFQYADNNNFSSPTTLTSALPKNRSLTGLTPNTIYFYRVYATNTGNSSSYNASSAITTGNDYVTTGDGNWDDDSKWNDGLLNNVNIANSITVRHPIVLNTTRDSVVTNKLIIESGGKLTTDQKIFVTNELIIHVDANGVAGQIKNTVNIIIGSNAKITVRKTFASGQWAFMGFPFTVTSSNVFKASDGTSLTWGDINSGANYVVQQYDGAGRASAATANYNTDEGQGLHWANVPTREFTAKKGYIIWNNTTEVIDFTTRGSNIGTFFSTSGATVSATRNESSMPEHSYWNLISTPLSSIFNLGSTSPGATYYTYNGYNYLPALSGEFLNVQPFSSFFLQASSTSISFANAGRRMVAATSNEQASVDDIRLTLSNGNATYNDLTRIRMQEGANAAYEIGTDAAKMLGQNPKISYIYTKLNNASLAINTLPKTISEVELTTKFAAAGNYSISISDIENAQSYSAVILIDKTTGKRTDLLAVGNYDFKVTAAGTVNRFKVQLAPKITTGVSLSDDQSIRIATQQNEAIILGLIDATQVRVFDTTGKTVFSGLVKNNEPIRFENKGLYIFEIATPEKTIQIKSFVR